LLILSNGIDRTDEFYGISKENLTPKHVNTPVQQEIVNTPETANIQANPDDLQLNLLIQDDLETTIIQLKREITEKNKIIQKLTSKVMVDASSQCEIISEGPYLSDLFTQLQ
jgi:hypothetical protein